jgi:pSer/pThr/pTyr-binding forkhead associated (FHA) protein
MPKLTYVVGSAGETRSVDVGDSFSIGSLPGSGLVLDASQGVSRRHCQILRISGGYEIADLGSTNGTKVNGDTVKKHKLAQGDRIEVGKVALTWDDGSGGAADEEISLEEPAGGGAPAARGAAAKSGAGASDQCMLVHAGGSDDGKKIALEKQRTTFGRNPKNVVVLADSGASGFHAEIAREGGAYVLRDLGSTNGTLVDGEPVSETALQHGARIRMGATRFVFVDPTVSDFEKAMAAVDDLGSEWGMLRAEMDMTRVQQARRSQIVTALVVLAVVGGGGAYVMTHLEDFTGKKAALAEVAGNRVLDFSFEDRQGADWSARTGTPTKARAGDAKSEGQAKQGSAFFAVTRDGPLGTCAVAQAGAASLIAVSPGRPAEFGAWVRATGGGAGGVRVVWLDAPSEKAQEIARSSTPLVTVSSWTHTTAAAMPPDAARAARIELINAAGGTAFFDDVSFVPGAGTAGGGQVKDGEVTVSVTGDGQATVARKDAKLFVDAAVVGGAIRNDALTDQSRRGDRSGSQSIASAGASTSGTFVDPDSGEAKPFTVKFKATEGRLLEIEATGLAGDAGWVATLPDEFVTEGVGVRADAGFRRAGAPHVFDKVLEVSFGGMHRFKVTKAEGCGPLRMALCRAGEQWEVAFGATDGNLKLVVDTDTEALGRDIEKLKADASLSKQQRRFGAAIESYAKLAAFFPEDSAAGAEIVREIKTLVDEGERLTSAVEAKVKGSVEFRDASALQAAETEAEKIAAEYQGHALGTRAKAALDEAAKALGEIRIAMMERAAMPIMRKADDCAKRTMNDLARAYYSEIVLRFPGTKAETTAREKLNALPKPEKK